MSDPLQEVSESIMEAMGRISDFWGFKNNGTALWPIISLVQAFDVGRWLECFR